jgi:diguanylate cyclase (GGDEF)-like protein/putative nucleotidyltransferase with HDIG domain
VNFSAAHNALTQMARIPDSVTNQQSSIPAIYAAFVASSALALLHVVLEYTHKSVTVFDIALAAAFLTITLAIRLDVMRMHRAHELLLVVGAGLVSIELWSDPPPHGGITTNAVMLVWFGLLAFYLLDRKRALLHAAWIALASAIALFAAPGDMFIAGWLVPIAAIVAFGNVLGMARLRNEVLIGYLQDAALRDPLTALLNRRGFAECFDREVERTRISELPLSVLFGDVDYFKAINDGFGLHAGDLVLGEVATLIMLNTRDGDTIARIGGEEYGVLLPGCDADAALVIAEQLRSVVQDAFATRDIEVTMSWGVATYGVHGETTDELSYSADKALYAAKEMGRNRAIGFSSDVLEILEHANIRHDDQTRTHFATLLTLAEALDLRDVRTATHSQTVAVYAELMAVELNLEPELVERVRLAGLLHDIGKIGVPDAVLFKPSKLDEHEWLQMKAHPEIGARILNNVDYTDIRNWVLAHHERIDGRGYPHGLAGDDIPLGARILSVADAYEAMTADRVYRKSMGHDFARNQLIEGKGAQFDARVVDAFLRVLDRGVELPVAPTEYLAPPTPLSEIPPEQESATPDAA